MKAKLRALINTPVSLLKGLRVTMANLLRTKATVRYPEVMPVPAGQGPAPDPNDPFERPYELAPRYRGLHGLTTDPVTGDLNCIGCMACAKVCPDDLISMDLEKREGHSGRYPVTFNVNIGPCCFCGLCSEVCPTPTRAIVMTDLFEWATYRRDGRNLVLGKDDLLRNGQYELERRTAGRQWNEAGELIGVNPEEEGNPYFQFRAEYEAEKARRAGDKGEAGEKPAREKKPRPEKPAASTEPVAQPAAGEDPFEAVRLAFEAAGRPLPADLINFDLATLDEIEDKVVRSRLKVAIAKARKLGAGQSAQLAGTAQRPQLAAEVDPLAALKAAFAAAGQPAPDDLDSFDLSSLDVIEDKVVRSRLKVAVSKARKALAEAGGKMALTPEDPPAGVTAPMPEPATMVEAEAAAAPPAPTEEPESLRARLDTLLREVGITPEGPLEDLTLEALDTIEDRKLKAQAKSTLRKLQKALGRVE